MRKESPPLGEQLICPSGESGAVATKKRCCCLIQAASFSSMQSCTVLMLAPLLMPDGLSLETLDRPASHDAGPLLIPCHPGRLLLLYGKPGESAEGTAQGSMGWQPTVTPSERQVSAPFRSVR